jgi:hypothetical protein
MSAVYLYGFAPSDARLPEHGLLGVGDVEVALLPGDGFVAVVGSMPASDFEGDALERNSKDVDWMARQGIVHEQVIAWFVDDASILPSRFLTLFSSTDVLARAMARDGAGIRDRLRRFEGLREWDLKVGYDAARLEEHLHEVSDEIRALDEEIAGSAPGRAFLLGRKRKDVARVAGRAAARRLASDLLQTLEVGAEDVVRLALTADDTPVVLNAALLVDRVREARVLDTARTEAERLARLGVTVQFTGPWAPYRFMDGPDGG